MVRKTDYHTMRINIDYNLYCQLKIRSFESGLGLYEFAKPEIDAFKQGLIKLCTPAQVLKAESIPDVTPQEVEQLKEDLLSQPTDSVRTDVPIEQQVVEQQVV